MDLKTLCREIDPAKLKQQFERDYPGSYSIESPSGEVVFLGEKKIEIELEIKRMFGTRYINKKIDDYQGGIAADIRNIIDNIHSVCSQGLSYFFYGNRGTGKTLGASHVARACLEAGKSVMYRRVQTLLLNIFDDRQEAERAKSVSMLILDEVGKTAGNEASGWELARVFEILDVRYANQKSTILISNISREKLGRYIGNDMLDRMKGNEWSRIIYAGQSLRGVE